MSANRSKASGRQPEPGIPPPVKVQHVSLEEWAATLTKELREFRREVSAFALQQEDLKRTIEVLGGDVQQLTSIVQDFTALRSAKSGEGCQAEEEPPGVAETPAPL